MSGDHGFDLCQVEGVQADNAGLRAKDGWQYHPGIFLAGYIGYEPRAMDAILASPIRTRQEMGARGQEHVNLPGAGLRFGGVWHFDEKSRHELNPPYCADATLAPC